MRNYRDGKWLDRVGHGAFCLSGDKPMLVGAIDAMNNQLALPVHIGGRTALARKGFLHFVPFEEQVSTLYLRRGNRLPQWFRKYFAGQFTVNATTFLSCDEGIETIREGAFTFLVSSPERAILELVEEVPRLVMLNEVYQILELLDTLRPELLQRLLVSCRSIKTKRLFLLLAEDLAPWWFGKLNIRMIDLGVGCRVVEKDGIFNAKYNVIVKPWREI